MIITQRRTLLSRRVFVAGAAAMLAATRPRAARALVESSVSGRPNDDRVARETLDAVAAITATREQVRVQWRVPSIFPSYAPIAFYAAHDGGGNPGAPSVWLNPDHPELVSPRVSNLTDEIPLFTELLLASVDLHVAVPSVGLERIGLDARRGAAAAIASNVAVIAKYTPYVAVDDAEFARRRFAFAVLRQLTPGIRGVTVVVIPQPAMPRDEPRAYYAGRDASAARTGVIRVVSAPADDAPRADDALLRAFVLATADRQPAESEPKRAYDRARARDEAASPNGDRFAARRAFAVPHAALVATFLSA